MVFDDKNMDKMGEEATPVNKGSTWRFWNKQTGLPTCAYIDTSDSSPAPKQVHFHLQGPQTTNGPTLVVIEQEEDRSDLPTDTAQLLCYHQ